MTSAKLSPTPRRSKLLALAAVLIVGTLLRVAFYSDQLLLEGVEVAESANSIGQLLTSDQLQALQAVRSSNRIDRPLLIATSFVFSLIEVTAMSSAIVPILSALIVGLLLWAIGRLVLSDGAGLMAAFLWLILPAGVFTSTQLIPQTFLLPLNLLVIYLYLFAKINGDSRAYVSSALFTVLGLWLHWPTMLASALFIGLDVTLPKSLIKKSYLLIVLLCITVLYLLASATGGDALNIVYLSRLIEENLVILPLLALCIAHFASAKEMQQTQWLGDWFAIKLLVMLATAGWISTDPIVETIGISTYWLDLMLPGALLIGWALNNKFGEKQTLASLPFICFGVGFLSLWAGDTAWLMAASRIAFGLGFFLYILLLGFWNSAEKQLKTTILLFLTFFTIGSLHINQWYVLSYSSARDNTRQLIAMLTEGDRATVFIQEEDLRVRMSYLLGFKSPPVQIGDATLNFELATADQSSGFPSGSYTAMSAHYRDFEFGAPLANWEPVAIFGTGPRQLLLFRVLP